jgi:hypothetical protein
MLRLGAAAEFVHSAANANRSNTRMVRRMVKHPLMMGLPSWLDIDRAADAALRTAKDLGCWHEMGR